MSSLVSIVVPVYKAEERDLCRMLDSIFNQTYKNIQPILVDDGSPDKCGEICDEYAVKDRRAKVIHKENGGCSSALNAGIDASDGEYVYLLNQDDYLDLQCVEKMCSAMERTGAGLCMCGMRNLRWDEKHQVSGAVCGLKSTELIISKKKPYEFYKFMSLIEEAHYFINKLLKTSVLKENKLHLVEDVLMYNDMVFVHMYIKHIENAVIIPEPLYVYGDSATSVSNKDIRKSYAKDCIESVRLLNTLTDMTDKHYNKALYLDMFHISTEAIFANRRFHDGLDLSREKKICFRYFVPYMLSPRVDFKYKAICFTRLFIPGLYVKLRQTYHKKKK